MLPLPLLFSFSPFFFYLLTRFKTCGGICLGLRVLTEVWHEAEKMPASHYLTSLEILLSKTYI